MMLKALDEPTRLPLCEILGSGVFAWDLIRKSETVVVFVLQGTIVLVALVSIDPICEFATIIVFDCAPIAPVGIRQQEPKSGPGRGRWCCGEIGRGSRWEVGWSKSGSESWR